MSCAWCDRLRLNPCNHLARHRRVDRGGHTDTTHTYKSVANGDMRSSRFIGFGEQLDLVGEVIIELEAPWRRWWRRRRRGRGKQNNSRRWGRRGSLDEGVGATPPVSVHSQHTNTQTVHAQGVCVLKRDSVIWL